MAVFILLGLSACSRPSTRLSTRRRDSPATSRRWQNTKQDSTLGQGRLPGLFVCANAGTTNEMGLTPLRRPCSDASVGHRMCVIAKGLGCLHWLPNAAEDGPFFWGASITQRAFPSVRAVCRRHLVGKLAVTARRTQLSSVSVWDFVSWGRNASVFCVVRPLVFRFSWLRHRFCFLCSGR